MRKTQKLWLHLHFLVLISSLMFTWVFTCANASNPNSWWHMHKWWRRQALVFSNGYPLRNISSARVWWAPCRWMYDPFSAVVAITVLLLNKQDLDNNACLLLLQAKQTLCRGPGQLCLLWKLRNIQEIYAHSHQDSHCRRTAGES